RPETYRVLGGRLVTPEEALATEGRLWLVVADRSKQPWEGVLEEADRDRRLANSWRWEFLMLYLYE
ncbi:MAG: hypothetical protein AB8I69_19815, partial [Anaerolineae bacterium]